MLSDTDALLSALKDTKNARIRHIVRQDATTLVWDDVTLCGHPWDMLKPPPNGTICDECKEEFDRRVKEGWI